MQGSPLHAAYGAAKGGVISLTQQAALDYAPHNVLINAIAPGTIDTPILKDITEEMRKVNANAHLLKRLGLFRGRAAAEEPGDVALHDGEQVVKIMSHPGGELADGFEMTKGSVGW